MTYHLFLVGLILGLLGADLAVQAQPQGQSYRFMHLGVDDGLSHRTVTALAQDSTGYLWIGTKAGLNRFDGRAMRGYHHVRGDTTALPSYHVAALLVDPEGTLWVGTNGGLSRFDRTTESFRSYRHVPNDPAGLCGPTVRRIAQDGAGGLWIGTEEHGLCHFDPAHERFTRVSVLGNTLDRKSIIMDFAPTPTGAVWVSVAVTRGPRVTCQLDRRTMSCASNPPQFSNGWHAIWSDARGQLWALQKQRGLLRLNTDAGTVVTHTPSAAQWGDGAVAMRPNGAIWAGTPRWGVVRFHAGRRTADPIRHDPGDAASLGGYDARTLFVDRQGIVWVGHERGLSYWTDAGSPFQLYRTSDGLSDERVNGIHEARDGTVWIATNGGLNRLWPAEDRFRAYNPAEQGLADADAVWQVYEDRRGTIWVGGKRDGLMRLNPETGRFSLVAGVAPGVRSISEDRSGRLWIGTSTGLFVRNPATGILRTFRHDPTRPNSLPSDRVNRVYESTDSTLWVATDEGIARMTHTRRDTVRFHRLGYDAQDPASLGAPVVWTMTETPADPGALWVGTFGGGMCRLDISTEQFDCLTAAEGLPHNVVYGLMTDTAGRLWATTDGGLARIDPHTQRIVAFGADDGLQDDAFDLMAYHQGRSGRLYVGGPRGFNSFTPEATGVDQYAPPVLIAGVRIVGKRRPGFLAPANDTLRLQPHETHLTFDLAALDYINPQAIRYRYRLQSASAPIRARPDSDAQTWRQTHATQPVATYTNLAPGAYTFEVHATNHAGVWSTKTTQLHVIVQPAWWQTVWVRWGSLLAMVGLVGGAVRWRITRLRAQQMEQLRVQRRLARERRQERHRIARDLHDGPIQDLYRVGHDLDRLADAAPDHQPRVFETRNAVNEVAQRLRSVLVALRPPHIEALGLSAALRRLARITAERAPTCCIRMESAAHKRTLGLTDEAEYALYRIAQEALTNAVQHAQATDVTLHLVCMPASVQLTVSDNGEGFRVPASLFDLAREEHFGLVGAAERAEAQGGTFQVKSTPGQGTTVRAKLPREQGAAHPKQTAAS
ncbi:sensor histidine kinase [Longimonas halophila]|nr:sensor histidine kinase [Longimonas halophila]